MLKVLLLLLKVEVEDIKKSEHYDCVYDSLYHIRNNVCCSWALYLQDRLLLDHIKITIILLLPLIRVLFCLLTIIHTDLIAFPNAFNFRFEITILKFAKNNESTCFLFKIVKNDKKIHSTF